MTETRVARAAGRAIVIAIVLLLTPLVPEGLAAEGDAFAPPVFAPIASTPLGLSTVLGSVAADGRGTMHSLIRSDRIAQQIIHRRSTDGGATWRVTGRFTGPQGATDPVLSVSGDHVLVGFRSIWCASATECAESVYVTWSMDAGDTWINPVRIGTSAYGLRVAVDGGRSWAAWNSYATGGVQLRGWTTNPAAEVIVRSFPGSVAAVGASGDVMGLALWQFGGGQVVVANEEVPGTVQFAEPALLPAGLQFATGIDPLAVAAGHVHVVLSPPVNQREPRAPRTLSVWSGDATGYFDGPVTVMAAGHSASIAADATTVGVAAVGYDGATRMATSADAGQTFSRAVEIAREPGMWEGGVTLAASVAPPADGPRARFDWSVPETFVDVDGDGWRDPENRSADASIDRDRIRANATMRVALDGCASTPGDVPIDRYEWRVNGVTWRTSERCSGLTREIVSGTVEQISLVVEDRRGRRSEVVQDVAPRNLVIASLGDSIASGEGVPMLHRGGYVWQDKACHRSALAGPSIAAARLEAEDPHTNVSFLHLACSGAAMLDTALLGLDEDPEDDVETGGIMDGYRGIVEPWVPGAPSQLFLLATLLGLRDPDAVLLSVGANDTRFSDVIKGCAVNPFPCNDPEGVVRLLHEARRRELPLRYAQLGEALRGMSTEPLPVLITEYFDQTTDDRGRPNLRCAINVFDDAPVGLINDDEARWASEEVGPLLNAAVRTAAEGNGWTYVGGIADKFLRHGYCASDPWAVTIDQSKAQQGDKNGGFHPNVAGHLIYGDRIHQELRRTVEADLPGELPGRASILGDYMAVTWARVSGTTRETLVSSAVRTDGGAPVVVGVRTIDTMVKGSQARGLLGVWDVAVDGASAVVSWAESDSFEIDRIASRLGVLATRTNVGITDVAVVQAPADGKVLVADRPALLLATVQGQVTEPTLVPVSILVEAVDDVGNVTVVYEDDEMLEVKPGRTRVVLPKGTSSQIVFEEGTRPRVTVAIEDPEGADQGHSADDVFILDEARAPDVVRTRFLDVLLGPIDSSSASPSCSDVRKLAREQVAFAADTMPVVDAGIDANLDCANLGLVGDTERDIIKTMIDLDEWGFWAGLDAVVAVTPPNALRGKLKGAEGIGAVGIRAVMVESSAARQALAHELSHSLGIDHTAQVPAAGVRVPTAAFREGVDWMEETGVPRVWTGGRTWDTLATAIGTRPQPRPFQDWPGVWVRGSVVPNTDGSYGIQPGKWIPAKSPDDLRPPPPPAYPEGYGINPADLGLGRVEVQQYDGDDPLGDPTVVLLRPVGGLGGEAALDGALFSEPVVLHPSATSLALLEGGTVVAQRAIGAAPVVEVVAPTAGLQVARGADLTVTWTVTDADSPAEGLSAKVMLSADGGASWHPFGDAGHGTSFTAPLPASIGGDAVLARVVVSDGLQFGQGDSAPFDAEPTVDADAEERVVFQRRGQDLDWPASCANWCPFKVLAGRIWTMRTDGSDPVEVPLPRRSAYSELDLSRSPFSSCDPESSSYACDPEYYTPRLSLDGRKVAFGAKNLFLPEFGGKGIADPNEPWFGDYSEGNIWIADVDGTGLERVTPSTAASTWWGHDWGRDRVFGVDNDCPALSPDGNRLAWRARPYGLVVSQRVGGVWSPPERLITVAEPPVTGDHWTTGTRIPVSNLPDTWPTPREGETTARVALKYWDRRGACPVWSPDGANLAFGAIVSYSRTDIAGALYPPTVQMEAVLVVPTSSPVDGSRAKVVTPALMGQWINYGSGDANFSPEPFYQRFSTQWSSATELLVDGWFPLEPSGVGTHHVRRFDLTNGTSSALYVPPPGAPKGLLRAQDGRFHGLTPMTTWRDGACVDSEGAAGIADSGSFTTVDPADDSVALTPPTDEPFGLLKDRSGTCLTVLDQFSLGTVATAGGTDIPALVAYDLATEPTPDDPGDLPGPPETDVTEVTVPDPAAPGPVGPLVAAPVAAPLSVTLRAGVPTVVRLGPGGDVPLRFEIRTPPPADELGVSSGALSSLGSVATGLDGTVVLTPAVGFSGPTSFTYAVVGSDVEAVVEVVVRAAPAVEAVADEFDGRAGEELLLTPEDLLGNDVAPEPDTPVSPLLTPLWARAAAVPSGLELLAAEGADNGWVELGRDGLIHVWPSREGVATFRYVVAAGEALGEGLVTIRVAPALTDGGDAGGGTDGGTGDGTGTGGPSPGTGGPSSGSGGDGAGGDGAGGDGAADGGPLPQVPPAPGQSPGGAEVDAGGLAATGSDVGRTALLAFGFLLTGVLMARPQRPRAPA